MPLHMEISLDGDSKSHVNEKPILEEQANQSIEENKVFYDACEDNEKKLQREPEWSKHNIKIKSKIFVGLA